MALSGCAGVTVVAITIVPEVSEGKRPGAGGDEGVSGLRQGLRGGNITSSMRGKAIPSTSETTRILSRQYPAPSSGWVSTALHHLLLFSPSASFCLLAYMLAPPPVHLLAMHTAY